MLGREGTIVSWTVIRVPPTGFSSLAPYPVVIVDLRARLDSAKRAGKAGLVGGGRITAQLVDPPAGEAGEAGWSENLFGKKVRVIVRRISEPSTEGIIPYGIKVKPI